LRGCGGAGSGETTCGGGARIACFNSTAHRGNLEKRGNAEEMHDGILLLLLYCDGTYIGSVVRLSMTEP
jgi:hypothetical protein